MRALNILALFLACNFATAQDTLYFYKSGSVVNKRAVAQIDSVIFYKTSTMPQGNTVKDADGNVYHTVAIGTQTWLVENLNTTKYNDGTAIPNVTYADWYSISTPAYCYYYDSPVTYKDTYGALYNWYAVNTGKLCPIDWHVSTEDEWNTLTTYLLNNGYNSDGSTNKNWYAKSLASTTNWDASTEVAAVGNTDYSDKRNATGFTALPGGYRDFNGTFYRIGISGYWWTSTAKDASYSWYWYLNSFTSGVYVDAFSKSCAFSVRCVKN
jgi:uncharacterized protein (TIGR02145 family)